MIPSSYVELTQIPLTTSGKVDRKVLENASLSELPCEVKETSVPIQPGKEEIKFGAKFSTEERLRQLFEQLFQISDLDGSLPLGSYGLNSLSFVRLSHEILKVFDVTLSAHEFYQFPSFDDLVKKLKKNPVSALVPKRKPSGSKNHDIAIIGYSGVFPGGHSPESLWNALLEGKDLITSSEDLRSHLKPFRAGLIPEIEAFDARFFSISPLEARKTDPRQRILLEQTWKTLENAGYTRDDLAQREVGCYIAATGSDFSHLAVKSRVGVSPYSLSGSSLSLLSNRISFFFDWRGPSYTLDSACSGSLNGLVNACQDLAHGVCQVALVGAANLILDDEINDSLKSGSFLSPRSRCASFDRSADGYVRGEGVVCLLVKRLDHAIGDRDAIYGVIKGYASNHGGRSTGLTAPNPTAQKKLLLKAYTPELARQVSFIETHGTGTQLGDPIEVQALRESWEELGVGSSSFPVYLGALKSNIGHLESAAGLASIVKVLKFNP